MRLYYSTAMVCLIGAVVTVNVQSFTVTSSPSRPAASPPSRLSRRPSVAHPFANSEDGRPNLPSHDRRDRSAFFSVGYLYRHGCSATALRSDCGDGMSGASCIEDGLLSTVSSENAVGPTPASIGMSLVAHVLTDCAHVALDFPVVVGAPSKIVLRYSNLVGRLFVLFADYIPDHYICSDELSIQLVLLGVALKELWGSYSQPSPQGHATEVDQVSVDDTETNSTMGREEGRIY